MWGRLLWLWVRVGCSNEDHFLECAGFGGFREEEGGETTGEGEESFYLLYSGNKIC